MFNGRDLTGWYVKDGKASSWAVRDGLVSAVAEEGGWLTTEREYADFILRLDWRIPEGGNSGVGIRYPAEGDPAHEGMEIQVLDDASSVWGTLKDAQYTGSIYYQVPAKRGAARPAGQWNHYEILCEGPRVRVTLNGTVVVDARMDEHTVGEGGHKPLSRRPRSGHIGLQSHNTGVDYRNVEIKEIRR